MHQAEDLEGKSRSCYMLAHSMPAGQPTMPDAQQTPSTYGEQRYAPYWSRQHWPVLHIIHVGHGTDG